MGIYESYSKGPVTVDPETRVQTWTEYQDWYGWKNSRTVTATPWVECERTTCYCCSCGEREGSDPYCRNHGFAGERRCEKHRMRGTGKHSADYQAGDTYRVDLVKLDSVQQVWARQEQECPS